MVQIYREPLVKRHYAGLFSEVVLFRLVLYLGALTLGLVIAFACGGFWIKYTNDLLQATVHYSGDALLLLEGDNPSAPTNSLLWSTSSTLNEEFRDNYIVANVQSGEIDTNNDGKPDMIEWLATVPSTVPIHSVKLLLQFTYYFRESYPNLRLQMYSLAYIEASSPVPGGTLYADGELLFVQRNPLQEGSYYDVFNNPMLWSIPGNGGPQAVQATIDLEFQSIITRYQARNYSTLYSNFYPVWQGSSGQGFFTMSAMIRIPYNQQVLYRPTVFTNIKWAWIQWLATFAFFWFIAAWAEYFIFRYRFLDTRVISDVHPPRQRF